MLSKSGVKRWKQQTNNWNIACRGHRYIEVDQVDAQDQHIQQADDDFTAGHRRQEKCGQGESDDNWFIEVNGRK